MIYFDKDFFQFFKDLSQNNNRDWFMENKKRYENTVKVPFLNFLEALIDALQEVEGSIPHTAKEAMMRINRDTRFSKDKTPYKDHLAAIISSHGKRNMRYPGMYVQINQDGLSMYSGCYQLEKEDLLAVRTHIKDHLSEFNGLINEPTFISTFGEIQGEKNKRLAPEFAALIEEQPLIANKGFYFFKKYPSGSVIKDGLVDHLIKDYRVGFPLGQFLTEGINNA